MSLTTPQIALAAVLVVLLGFAPSAFADCEPDGDVQFLCGPKNPEDLIAIPGTPWVIVSSLASEVENEGLLHIADTRDLTTTVAFPLADSEARLDAGTYGSCPGMDNQGFVPHGVSLRVGDSGGHTLYVVRHGSRESVEVFDVDTGAAPPTLTWVGCVPAPEGVSFNSVAPLPDGAIAGTNFKFAGGEVWEWQLSSGWSQVPGGQTAGPNGLVASPDGKWLFIGGWGSKSVIRLSRGQTPVQKDAVDVGFHVDNLRWTDSGSLLAAGQGGPNAAAIGGCLTSGNCKGVAARVVEVDPSTLEVQERVDYPSNELIVMGTAAIRVGNEIWLGAIAGSDRIARFPAE